VRQSRTGLLVELHGVVANVAQPARRRCDNRAVSTGNVEIARRAFAAIAGGDVDAVRDLLHPDVRWHGGDPTAPGACRNRDQALVFMRRAHERGSIGELVDVIDAGDDQIVVVMRPPGAGSELRANVTTFRNEAVVEIVAYESPEAALAAAGLGGSGSPRP
jgi:ketosteroid isomerase-like protein